MKMSSINNGSESLLQRTTDYKLPYLLFVFVVIQLYICTSTLTAAQWTSSLIKRKQYLLKLYI